MAVLNKYRVSFAVALVLVSTVANPTFSQTDDKKPTQENIENSGFIFIPALFYTPETKVAGGASVIYFFRNADSPTTARPSTIQPTFIYTQRKQTIASLSMDLYWKQEAFRLNGEMAFTKYPDKFYGIGPGTTDDAEEDYTPKTFALLLNFFTRIRAGFHLGLLYEYRHDSITEVADSGLLAAGIIPGSAGGTVSGAGVVANWDTRDNIFYPTRGSFHQFSAAFFGSALGSDFGFNRYILDLRKYHSLSTSGVVAFQTFVSLTSGTPPFQSLSQFGGANLMRGYYEGRYRDKHVALVQTEYRRRLFGRFGVVGFLGFGQVARRVADFDLGDVQTSFGLGLRYLWSRSEGINIRVDVGFSGGSPGPYITISEAF